MLRRRKYIKIIRNFSTLLIAGFFVQCTTTPFRVEKAPAISHRDTFYTMYPDFSHRVKDAYLSLSLEEKIAQLLIIPLFIKGVSYTTVEDAVVQYVHKIKPGGFILFKNNIIDATQLQKLTADLKKLSPIHPFIAMDVEGGLVNRLRNIPNLTVGKLPSARRLTVTETTQSVEAIMTRVGRELSMLGVSMNLAPVADIRHANTPNFLVERIFGSTPQETSLYVAAVIRGLKKAGVIAVAKHFPGHGAASNDTHSGLAEVSLSKDMLELQDFMPFKVAIENDVDAIMAGHLYVPAMDSSVPIVEISSSVISYLRNTLHFNGVIITDSLSMKAVKEKYVGDNFAEKALQAGITILLDPPNAQELHTQLVKSFKSGRISEKTLELSVLRVLRLKEQYNLL